MSMSTQNVWFGLGDVIEVAGKEYLVESLARTKFDIVGRDLKTYKIDRNAKVNVIPREKVKGYDEWVSKIKSMSDFNLGATVRVTAKLNGETGVIGIVCGQTAKNVKIVVPGKGTINLSPKVLERVDAVLTLV